jgi:exopolysaccharide biosynthesis WecB/TagA/CpsF family protein
MLTSGLFGTMRAEGRAGAGAVRRSSEATGAATPRLASRGTSVDAVDPTLINEVISRITLVKDREQADALIARCLDSESPQIVSFLNAHGLNVCFRNSEFITAVLESDVILRDGIGMQLLFKALKRDAGLNMNGTDLIPEMLNKARGHTVGILGTSEPHLSGAVELLVQAGHNVIVRADGFKDPASYLTLIERHRPRIIVLAMGMPKQEIVALHLKENATYNPIIINGGAVVDFIAGKVRRAPRWMRQMHMEWIFRLMNEPKRLFKRYVIGNLVFLLRIKDIRRTYTQVADGEVCAFESFAGRRIPANAGSGAGLIPYSREVSC